MKAYKNLILLIERKEKVFYNVKQTKTIFFTTMKKKCRLLLYIIVTPLAYNAKVAGENTRKLKLYREVASVRLKIH